MLLHILQEFITNTIVNIVRELHCSSQDIIYLLVYNFNKYLSISARQLLLIEIKLFAI